MYIKLLLLQLLLIFSCCFSIVASVNVYVDSSSPVRNVPETFLSVAFDSANEEVDNWVGLNWTFVQPLAQALTPAYFRLGGTRADFLLFKENATSSLGVLSSQHLDELWNFAHNVGWKLILDLNSQFRNSDGSYNTSNVKQLLDYSSARGYDLNFELGNEPEWDYKNDFNWNLTGTQLAASFRELRNLLNSYDLYKNSIVMGPSVGTDSPRNLTDPARQVLQDFLASNGGDYVNAISFHYYYEGGRTAQLKDFVNPNVMNNYVTSIQSVLELKNSFASYQNLPLWAGEASSCYNGGAENISDRYAASFLFTDMLGASAFYGLDKVLRQQWFDGYWHNGSFSHYALLDVNMRPNPDYWLAFLYKKLVGQQVYNVSTDSTDPHLRLYAGSNVNNNGVVIYGVWLSNESITLDFPNANSKQATVYLLKESEPGNLQSHSSTLNGRLLEWKTHEPLPDLARNVATLPIQLPGYSQFFIVINQNQDTQCPTGWYNEVANPNKCIKFIAKSQPLFSANFDCSTFGTNATLLSIDSAFENKEINNQARNNSCSQLYIGLARNGNSWSWTNQDTNNYRNWKSGYPISDNTKNCVTFDPVSGAWTNEDCDIGHCYVCQKYV